MQRFKLGTHGPEVSEIALGCMGMGERSFYGSHSESESIATIHAALDQGINLLDTGDFYSLGRNELLVGKALSGKRDKALLSVKFGALRAPDGSVIGYDGRPQAVKNFLSYSLSRLGVDYIDIYRPSRVDPAVPIEETIGAIADMVKAGYVRYIGVSELGADTLRRAATVHPLTDLQIEYSLVSRAPEQKIFPALRELGMATTAYGVFSRGLLTGSKPSGPQDFRSHLPRFAGENAEANAPLKTALARIAAKHHVSASQMAIAWVRAKSRSFGGSDLNGSAIIPTIGARTRTQLEDIVAGLHLRLTPDDVSELELAVPAERVAGTRYAPALMAYLDSER